MPVLLGSIGDRGNEVEARAAESSSASSSSTTEHAAGTSADALLDGTSVTGLLRAGPRADSSQAVGTVERFLGAADARPVDPIGGSSSPRDPLTGPDGEATPATEGPESTETDSSDADTNSADTNDAATSDAATSDAATSDAATSDAESDDPPSRASEPEEPEPDRPAPTTTAPPVPSTPAPTAPAPPEPPTAPAAPAPASPPAAASEPAGGEPTAAQWAALRQCEAWGDYTVVSGNGKYFGAYQFSQGTWDNVARQSGRSDLVGVRPSDASAADQDALALALWRSSGWSSWPSCGKKAAAA